MKIIKSLFYLFSGLFPLNFLRFLAKRDFIIINYHSISGADPDPLINKNIYRTEKEFISDIRYYKKEFNIISLFDVLDLIIENKPLPKNSLLLTFDDGLKSVFDIIRPILKEQNVTATFFLNPNFIDNKDLHFQRKKNLLLSQVSDEEIESKKEMWKDLFKNSELTDLSFSKGLSSMSYHETEYINQLMKLFNISLDKYFRNNQIYLSSQEVCRMIKEGFTFGAHSMDHPNYKLLNIEQQYRQTIESIHWIKRKFDLDYSVFAFPHRDHEVKMELFEKISDEVIISFGVRGIGDDVIPYHLQRIDVESTSVSASRAIKLELIKYIVHKVLGRSIFKR